MRFSEAISNIFNRLSDQNDRLHRIIPHLQKSCLWINFIKMWQIGLKVEEDVGKAPAGSPSYNQSRNPESTKFVTVSLDARKGDPPPTKTRGKMLLDSVTHAARYRSTARTLSTILLERNMGIWGVDPNKSQVHKNFWIQNLEALKKRNEMGLDIQPVMLSDRFDEAALTVLTQEIQHVYGKANLYVVIDHLNDGKSFGPPYRFHENNHLYEIRDEYKHFTPELLDPFVRFTAIPCSPLQRIQKEWSNEIAYRALMFRALVGQHACHLARCVSCGSVSNLHWNVSTENYPCWSRLVCTSCNSAYAIKTVASSVKLQKILLERQVNRCGFLDAFYCIRRKNSAHSGAKQYIALVCLSGLEGPAPVFVAEVVRVEPQLKPISFVDKEHNFIFSKAILGNGYHYWFDIPSAPRDIESVKQVALSCAILKDYFNEKS